MKNRHCCNTVTANITLFAVIALLSAGCGFFQPEDSLEIDKQEQTEVLEGIFVTYWKGAKISIRSLPISSTTKTIDFDAIRKEQSDRLNLGKHLSRIYDWESLLKDESKSPTQFTAKEFMEFAQEVYAMSDTINDMDEDEYPTFAQIISYSNKVLNGKTLDYPDYWNNSMDHWLFAIVMETRFGLGSWKTYELDRVDIKEINTTDFRVLAALHKGVDHLRNEWFYLAEHTFSQALTELEQPKVFLNSEIEKLISQSPIENLSSEEQFRLFASATTHLLRGLSRHKTGDAELSEMALEDIVLALEKFNRLGVENELVWLAQSYVAIKNNKPKEALLALSKLEKSKYLTDKEVVLITKTKEHINDRDPEGALNFITDKVFMYKLGLSYAISYTTEIEWMQLLEKTEEGRRILKRFSELEQTFNKAKGYLDLDKVKQTGEKLFKNLTG